MSERGDVADWLGTGLQSPLIGFDSRRRLNWIAKVSAEEIAMSRTISKLLFVGSVVVLAACGSESTGYPEVFRESFVYGCISNGGSEKACRCILDEMESTYTYEQAVELDREALAGEDVSGEFEALLESCIKG